MSLELGVPEEELRERMSSASFTRYLGLWRLKAKEAEEARLRAKHGM